MPLLQRTAERTNGTARFVGYDVEDERASAAALLAATGVRYEVYEDPDGRVRAAVRAAGLPVTIVFDARGRQIARRFGEIHGTWLDDALRRVGVALRPAPQPPTTSS